MRMGVFGPLVRRGDLAIFIEYDMPIVEVSLLYVGDDKGV